MVPATFVDGAFDASVQVGELYTLSGQGPGGYYLSVTVDSRLYNYEIGRASCRERV